MSLEDGSRFITFREIVGLVFSFDYIAIPRDQFAADEVVVLEVTTGA
jgi:hypothetical protein